MSEPEHFGGKSHSPDPFHLLRFPAMGEYHQLQAKPESPLVQSLWSLVILMFFLVPGYSSPLPAPPDTLTEADYSIYRRFILSLWQ